MSDSLDRLRVARVQLEQDFSWLPERERNQVVEACILMAREWREKHFPEVDYPLQRVLMQKWNIDIDEFLALYGRSIGKLPIG